MAEPTKPPPVCEACHAAPAVLVVQPRPIACCVACERRVLRGTAQAAPR